MIRKQNDFIVDVGETILTVWVEDQTSHTIPLSWRLIKSMDLTPFNSMKAESDEEASEE